MCVCVCVRVCVCVCVCMCVCRTNEEVLEVIRSGRSSALTLCQVTILWEQAPDDKDVRTYVGTRGEERGNGESLVKQNYVHKFDFYFQFQLNPCLSLLAYPGSIVSIIALKRYIMHCDVCVHMLMQRNSWLNKHEHQCWLNKHEHQCWLDKHVLYSFVYVNLHRACELKHASTSRLQIITTLSHTIFSPNLSGKFSGAIHGRQVESDEARQSRAVYGWSPSNPRPHPQTQGTEDKENL